MVDPVRDVRWDVFVDSHPQGMIFHRSEWASVLIEAYGYEPRYHVLETDAGVITAAWPAMLVRSRLTGTRLVTMPFSDHCSPLVRDDHEGRMLLDSVLVDARENVAARVELRGWPESLSAPNVLVSAHGYVRHVVDLTPGRDMLLKGLSENARRSVKRAEKNGVTTRFAETPADFDLFLALNRKLRRRHGMLPQPVRFFHAIRRNLIERGMGSILLAERAGVPLAALLLLRHRDVTLDKYAVNDPSLLEYRGSHLAMWKAIEAEAARGARWYDMGRSDATAVSLHRFKEQWGAAMIDAPYYYHPAPGGQNTADPAGFKKTILELFARVAPNPIYDAAGKLVYRHLG
jgi:lipid II:glycine glycyltransferase (peptidoglycan interpeptide bridge formation enzyme)